MGRKMTLKLIWVVFGALLFACGQAYASTTYEVDSSNSKVEFKIRRLSQDVQGEFKRFQGKIELEPSEIRPSHVSTTIDTASIDTKAQDRDEYLKSRGFFNAEKYPEITFKSKKVENGKIVGDLTMHGVTKEVEFDFVFRGFSDDPKGSRRAHFSATTMLNRRDFGILFSRLFDRGGMLLSNTIFMAIEFQAIATG